MASINPKSYLLLMQDTFVHVTLVCWCQWPWDWSGFMWCDRSDLLGWWLLGPKSDGIMSTRALKQSRHETLFISYHLLLKRCRLCSVWNACLLHMEQSTVF